MANNDSDFRSRFQRMVSTGLIAGGIGYAGYRTLKDNPNFFSNKANEVLRKTASMVNPTLIGVKRVGPGKIDPFKDTNFAGVVSALEDIATTQGQREILGRAYRRAMFRQGVVATDEINDLVERLVNKSITAQGINAGGINSALSGYTNELGSVEDFYRALGDVTGVSMTEGLEQGLRSLATNRIRRRTDFLSSGKAVTDVYIEEAIKRSAFDPGGSYWSRNIDLQMNMVADSVAPLSNKMLKLAKRLEKVAGVPVSIGVADPTTGVLLPERGVRTAEIPGVGKVSMSHIEIRFGGAKGPGVKIPFLSSKASKKGYSIVAAGKSGVAGVGRYVVPKPGGGVELVDFNSMIETMLFGDAKRGINEGLAMRVHKLAQEGKSFRQEVDRAQRMIASQFSRYNGVRGGQVAAEIQMSSAVPLDHLIDWKGDKRLTMENLHKLASDLQNAGHEAWASSPGPAAEHGRLLLRNYAKEWDVFGVNFPMERRFLQKVRPEYEMAASSVANMADRRIFGMIGRGAPITATKEFIEQGPQATNLVSMYVLKKNPVTGEVFEHLSPEEGLYSRRVENLLEMRSVKKVVLAPESISGIPLPKVGDVLRQGQVIGAEASTRKTIKGRYAGRKLRQKIADVVQTPHGIEVSIESTLGAQNQVKIFQEKIQLSRAYKDIREDLRTEAGIDVRKIGAGGPSVERRLAKATEVIIAGSALKKVPAMVQKQMAEGLLLNISAMTDGYKTFGEFAKSTRGQSFSIDHAREVWDFTRGDVKRTNMLRGFAEEAAKTGAEHAIELSILKKAKEWGMSPHQIGTVGGYWAQEVAEGLSSADLQKRLKDIGLSVEDVGALKNAEYVMGMTQFYAGDFGEISHWGRTSLDPRLLRMWQTQQLGETGDLVIAELLSRRVISSNYDRMAEAATSFAEGRTSALVSEVRRIKKLDEAKEVLGKEGFVLEHGGRSIFVPGPEVKGMGLYRYKSGAEPTRNVLANAYNDYITALGRGGGVEEAGQVLKNELYQGLLGSAHYGGEIIGSQTEMAKRYRPRTGKAAMHFGSVEELAKSGTFSEVFVGRKEAERAFRDILASDITTEQRAFIEMQKEKFFKGESIESLLIRNPTHRPQSGILARARLAEENASGISIPKRTLTYNGRVIDVSGAHGSNLDFDADRITWMPIQNAKVAKAVDDTLKDRVYINSFVNGVYAKYELQDAAKRAVKVLAKRGDQVGSNTIAALNKLIGVKVVTGPVTSLVEDMKFAVAYASPNSDTSKSLMYILSEVEEAAAIASKHGQFSTRVPKLLKNFLGGATGEGGIKAVEDMEEALATMFDLESFNVGGKQLSRREVAEVLHSHIQTTAEVGALGHWRMFVKARAKAAKHAINMEVTEDILKNAVLAINKGAANSLETIERAFEASGVAAAARQSRSIVGSMGELASMFAQGAKKHWKYPALAIGAAMAASWVMAPRDLKISSAGADRRLASSNTETTANIPSVEASPPRIQMAGGSSMMPSFNAVVSGDYGVQGTRHLAALASTLGASIRFSDNRGAITPEYIRKIEDERYD